MWKSRDGRKQNGRPCTQLGPLPGDTNELLKPGFDYLMDNESQGLSETKGTNSSLVLLAGNETVGTPGAANVDLDIFIEKKGGLKQETVSVFPLEKGDKVGIGLEG